MAEMRLFPEPLSMPTPFYAIVPIAEALRACSMEKCTQQNSGDLTVLDRTAPFSEIHRYPPDGGKDFLDDRRFAQLY